MLHSSRTRLTLLRLHCEAREVGPVCLRRQIKPLAEEVAQKGVNGGGRSTLNLSLES
jgi:hypothetical protein